MATVDALPPPLDPQPSMEHPSTARHPGGRPAHEPTPFNHTPDREEESKRRRVSSEPSREVLVSAAASGGSNAGCPSRASSGSSASTSTQAGADSGSQGSFSQGLEDALRSHLASWAMRLVQLQPKVHVSEHLLECGLYIFKYLRQLQVQACLEGKFPFQYLSNEQLLIHDLAACWWVALKHCSVRTAVPNRTLMCRATAASPELLADREMATLVAIDWEVQAVLRHGGLVM